MNRSKGQRAFTPKDFIVDFEPRKPRKTQTPLQMLAFMRQARQLAGIK